MRLVGIQHSLNRDPRPMHPAHAMLYFALLVRLYCRHNRAYRQMRHTVVIVNRLVKFCLMVLNYTTSNTELYATVARAMNVKKTQQSPSDPAALSTAVLNIARPMSLGPLLTMAHVRLSTAEHLWL